MSPASSHLDRDRLARMGVPSDREVTAIFERFVQSLSNRLSDLEEKLHAGDRTGLRRGLHQLRGAASSCGFSALAAACSGLEPKVGEAGLASLRNLAEVSVLEWRGLTGAGHGGTD